VSVWVSDEWRLECFLVFGTEVMRVREAKVATESVQDAAATVGRRPTVFVPSAALLLPVKPILPASKESALNAVLR
jgi:hypothetical protein